ncbi:MAG: M20/M25/M40 family metallo-hydrolase [Thermofilaceae archaeon]
MSKVAEYAYEIAVKLASQSRFAGSEGESIAREIVYRELESFGYEVKLEAFLTKVYEVKKAELRVISPESYAIECSAIGFSGETAEEGVEGEIVYIESGDTALLPENIGWIGLASSRPNKDAWKKLVGKASGLIVAENSPFRDLSRVDIPYEWRERFGNLPAVYVRYSDAVKLFSAKRVMLTLLQEYRDAQLFNVVAELKGTKYPSEVVYVVAHLDSEYGVPGATDNAAGVALALAVARELSKEKPKRTVRFVLFSGEELGLRGSLAYVEAHKGELEKTVLVVNLDVHGAALGTTSAVITGSKSLRYAFEYVAKKLGININVSEDVMSSDSASFARRGVPSISIFRSSGTGHLIHTVQDSISLLHPKGFGLVSLLAFEFIREVTNSEEVPFEKEIPEDVRRKVDDYFRKRLGIYE